VPLVGTPDRIVAGLEKFAGIGLDGMLLSWVDYVQGLDDWQRDMMPRLAQAGLRMPLSI
jgi:alkanesulfonate monooxygenase SsuD/methylene tetrahydromethanopterin reductase-like flavin-dependent oxidoreductase (luciferase family)